MGGGGWGGGVWCGVEAGWGRVWGDRMVRDRRRWWGGGSAGRGGGVGIGGEGGREDGCGGDGVHSGMRARRGVMKKSVLMENTVENMVVEEQPCIVESEQFVTW